MRLRRIGSFFCVVAALAILISVGFSPALLAESIENASTPKHITLTWTGDTQTTQTITWQTDEPVTGQVRFAKKGETEMLPHGATRISSHMQPVTTNQGIRYIHSTTLTGLKPGGHYIYQVSGGSAWSEQKTFTTARIDSKEFTFLVFGDSQSINYDTWRSTLQNAHQAQPGAAFITNVGDLVDVGQDYAQWHSWFTAGKGIIDSIPVMPIPGNHESYTVERKFSMPTLFTAQFSLPLNGPEGMQEQAYSFNYGDVHFVMLDSQAGEQKQFLPDLLARQKVWLEKDLAQTTKRFTIVFIHRPLYDNKTFRDNIAIRETLTPLFDAHQVDVVFTGHDHVYARTYPVHNSEVSPDGTIYVATGRSGSKSYSTVTANPLNEFFYNPQDEPNYLIVAVTADSISVKAFKQSGTLIDAWEVNKRQ
ncbi:MAG: metallophosphoesterase [Anaerosporomusa subterranea]|nr:metallophosphoesterase [Anaerosporomusa subterranea]